MTHRHLRVVIISCREGFVLWFWMQSISMSLISLGVGLAVGWLVWGRGWKTLDESTVISRPYTETDPVPVAAPAAAAAAIPAQVAVDVLPPAVADEPIDQPIDQPDDEPAADDPDTASVDIPAAFREAVVAPIELPVESPVELPVEPPVELPVVVAAEPEEPWDGPGDNLTLIKGVSPTVARALVAEGFDSFAAVAAAPQDQLRRVLRLHRIRQATGIATWSRQAELLVDSAVETPVVDVAEPVEPVEVVEVVEVVEPVEEPIEAPNDRAEHVLIDLTTPTPTRTVTYVDAPAEAAADEATDEAADEGAALAVTDAEAAPSADLDGNVPPATAPTVITLDGDDLLAVAGVDPEIAAALRAGGVATYAQLAAARDHELQGILTGAGIAVPPAITTWSVQAALLLIGDADGARTLAHGLMVGRESV